jgi:hypothetical protein
MTIYHYHPVTGEYMGSDPADESPLEPGVFLIPAHATDVKPPEASDGQVVRWNGAGWESVPPEQLPEADDAPTPAHDPAEQVRAERDRRIEAVMWRVQRFESETRLGLTPTDDIAALDAYVQALRDVPQQAGFPESVEWPEGL